MTKQHPQPPDTRNILLDTAEHLFLTHGFEGVSIRQITRSSKTNVASVNYHFGDKTGLFREVLTHRLEQITGEKLSLLNRLDCQIPAPTLEDILDQYIRSFFDSHDSSTDNDRLMQLIYREMGPDAVTGDLVATHLIIPINQAFKGTIMRVCPELDDIQASFSVSSITAQILHFIRSREILRTLRNQEQNQTFIEDIICHITHFSLRGIGRS